MTCQKKDFLMLISMFLNKTINETSIYFLRTTLFCETKATFQNKMELKIYFAVYF